MSCGKQPGRRKFPGRVLPTALFGHGVKAPAAEGVAPGNAPGPQQNALQAPMGLDGLDGVPAAGGGKAAIAAKGRAQPPLVPADGRNEGGAGRLLQRVHSGLCAASGCFLRAGGTVAGGFAPGCFALSGNPACANSFATTLDTCQLLSFGVRPRATKTRS